VASLNLDELKEDDEVRTKSNKNRKSIEFNLDELFRLPVDKHSKEEDKTFEVNYVPQNYSHDAPDFEDKCLNMTGKDLIFYLLESTHLGNAVSFYLNLTNSKEFRPYDLITVPKSQVNISHFKKI
jgi:hypothetical protein